jgi:DNA-binding NarL/FixJ family response regulator
MGGSGKGMTPGAETAEIKQMLLVCNDPECVGAIRRVLAETGPVGILHVAADRQSALSELRKTGGGCPRLVVLDLDMPHGCAFGFLETLKADPVLRTVPVVVLGACDHPHDVAACYDLGAAGYLGKSNPDHAFAEAIRSACGYWGLSRVPVT